MREDKAACRCHCFFTPGPRWPCRRGIQQSPIFHSGSSSWAWPEVRLTQRSLLVRESRSNRCWGQYGFFLGLLMLSYQVQSAEATIAMAANFRETAQVIAERLE